MLDRYSYQEKMSLEKMSKISLNYPYVSAILFLVLLFTSIIVYNGGSAFETTPSGYSFTQNFLSDLGREDTFRREDNTPSRIFFGLSMAVIASGFTVLSINGRKLTSNKGHRKLSGKAAAMAGIVSSVFLVSAGALSWDTMFWAHVWSVNLAFLCIFLYVVFSAFAQITNGISRKYYLFNVFVAVCIITQLLLLIFGPHYRTREGLPVQVVAQKVIVIVFIANLLLQSYGVKRMSIKN